MATNDKVSDKIEKYCSTLCQDNQVYLRRFVRDKLLAGAKPNTIYSQLRSLRSLINYTNDAPLNTITAETIEDWYMWYRDNPSKLTGRKHTGNTLVSTVMGVRHVMESVCGEDKANELFRRIKPPRCNKVTVKEDELMTDDEIYRMLQACDGERDRAIIALLASSGCRVGELCNLKIHDVKMYRERATLHLDGKTGPRDIDIYDGVPELKRWMQVHPYRDDPDAPLFVSKYVHGSGTTAHGIGVLAVEKVLSRIADKAEIPADKRRNPHSFRHKRATDLADHLTTADLKVMFGWTDMSTTPNIYVHSSRQKVSKKLAQLAGVKVPEHAVDRKLVKYCPVCGCANSINDKWCNYCFAVLDEEIAEAKRRVDAFLLQGLTSGKKEER